MHNVWVSMEQNETNWRYGME